MLPSLLSIMEAEQAKAASLFSQEDGLSFS